MEFYTQIEDEWQVLDLEKILVIYGNEKNEISQMLFNKKIGCILTNENTTELEPTTK